MVDAFREDLRSASRALLGSRAFAAWVVGSLTIGMAVTIAALALLLASLVAPFPGVTDQHRLVRISILRNCGAPDCWIPLSSSDEAALREGLIDLQGLAQYRPGQIAAGLPDARSLRAMFGSAEYFDVLRVRPALGRMFDASDARARTAVAVIAYDTWTREFNADPSAIGRSVRVGDDFVQIVGVAPPSFVGLDFHPARGDRGPDIWLPLWLADRVSPTARPQDVAFVGRLRDGADVHGLQVETEVVGQRLAGGTRSRIDVRRVWRVNPEHWYVGVAVILPIPILVLVIACLNAANLMLARGSQRVREIAIRLAIGASRSRIVSQWMLESAALTAISTAVAIPIAWVALRLVSNPLGMPIPLDSMVVGFTVVTAALTTIGFGLGPAMHVSALQPSKTLGSAGGRADAAPHQSRFRRFLVTAQVALSIALLATAWQLVSTVRAQAVSAGTPADRLLIARFNLRSLKLGAGEGDQFYQRLIEETAHLPGAEAAGLARQSSIWTFGQGTATGSVLVWNPADQSRDGRVTLGGYAGATLFEAVGLRVLAGRSFTDADRRLRPQVAIVNESFARNLGGPPLGTVLRVAPRGQDYAASIEVRVVGMIESAIEPRLSVDSPPPAAVYLPSPIEPEPALALYVRTSGRAVDTAQNVRELVARIAPRVPIIEIGSLEDFNEQSFAAQLWLARAAAVLGLIGLLLAGAGLYGVSSYLVSLRTREMAIRMVVGARPSAIVSMVLGQSLRMAITGLVVGGGLAIGVSRAIQSGYHGIEGIDRAALAAAAAFFLSVILVASAIPAIRAARVDLVEHLKDA
jgi:predicted permease